MPAIEPLCRTLGIDIFKLSREENLILEAEIFIHLYKELNEIFRPLYKKYFYLMRFNKEMEEAMLQACRYLVKIFGLLSKNPLAYATTILSRDRPASACHCKK